MTRFELADTGATLDITIDELIIAGWAGREQAGIQEHIEELKAIGVTPPSATPLFYRVSADRLTTANGIQVLGDASSGEAEVLLLGSEQGLLVGIASDHTDREAEAWSVAHSKEVCAKPAGSQLWSLDTVLPHWDSLCLESYATIDGERTLYQQGPVSGLLPPAELLARFGQDGNSLRPGQAMLCGTLPVHGGVRSASRFEIALIDPVRNKTLQHAYDIQSLPIVS